MKRLRWKVFFHDKRLNDSSSESSSDNDNHDPLKNTYGFRSSKTPPHNEHLKKFEDDLYQMIQDVEFDNKQNHLQHQLKRDVREIKSSKKLTICADKSPNLYEMEVNDYKRMLQNNITTSYKKSTTNNKADIDNEAKQIVSSLGIADRVQCIAEKDAFITLKDHKETFRNKPTCRLINPTKSVVGHISKTMLEGSRQSK